ncbi:BACON domain-containing protein [Streptomyces sp. UG1]|uniref:BACON domain-containing protein n=1 Tax=Streptomyces sp. UG1 TaxID=3417652 RepID=UPI003CECC5B0
MMSSTPQTSTRTAGAHRAHREARDRAAARTLAQRPPARYEPYLDGLFTYCLSVLCDHDAATAALGDVLALAERRGQRVPQAAADRRPWLYALARWACLRKLAEAKQKRQGSHAARSGAQRPTGERAAGTEADAVQEQRRRELALLAWPEAAGTTPEQREALELAVRHHLAAHEVAAVLGLDLATARELLASAACEVERTRAALAVVEIGACPSVARLTGDNQLVLGTALRRELVRHVDDCPRCRRTAERAIPGRWPGAAVTPAELPILQAPRAALHMALAHQPRARGGAVPRFDRRGFPMDPKDRAARRDRLRARAVTTTVVATVVAAPVLALWAAYRSTPTADGADGGTASASEAHGPGALDGEAADGGYENTGNAGTRPGGHFGEEHGTDVLVEVVSVSGARGAGAGQLDVAADSSGDTTLITLTATGRTPVRWSASTGAHWLYLSRSAGTLAPGESLTIKVYVDQLREPSGHWSARVAIAPAGAVVSIEGYGTAPSPSDPAPRPTEPTTPATPADPPPSSSGPDPTPTTPPPSDPAPTDPTPSEPTTSEPPPSSPEPSSPDPPDPTNSTPPPSGSGEPSPSGS